MGIWSSCGEENGVRSYPRAVLCLLGVLFFGLQALEGAPGILGWAPSSMAILALSCLMVALLSTVGPPRHRAE